jgi:hypothetical protein
LSSACVFSSGAKGGFKLNERVTVLPAADQVFDNRVGSDERDFEADQVIDVEAEVQGDSGKQPAQWLTENSQHGYQKQEFNRMKNADTQIRYLLQVFVNILPEVAEHA